MCTKSSSIHGKDIVNPHAAWIVTGMPKNETKVSNSCFSHPFSFKHLWPLLGLDKHGWVKQEKEMQFLQHYSKIDEDFIGWQRDLYKGCERTWVIWKLWTKVPKLAIQSSQEGLGSQEKCESAWREGKCWKPSADRFPEENDFTWNGKSELFNPEKDMKWNGLLQRSEAVQKWPEHLVRSEKMWLQR